MEAHLFARPWRKIVLTGGIGALFTLATLGCEQGDASASGAQTPASSASQVASVKPSAAEAKKPLVASGKAEYKEEAFVLKITAPKTVKAGIPAEYTITLEAQSGYKVNDEYPLKFQFADQGGVRPEKKIVRKDEAKIEKMRATIPLKVTVEKSGSHSVTGKLSFSVCTDERCLIEKRDLSVVVNAS